MNTLQEASSLFKTFKRGGPAFGGWQVQNSFVTFMFTPLIMMQMLPGTNHSRAIARSGVDWICVDCEHGNIDGMKAMTQVAVIMY
jgi:4-hydroxy-2-oxoheptanedioate aldolase